MDKCTQKIPRAIRYRSSRMVFVMNTQVSSGLPSYENIIERWYIDEGVNLPAGLTLNELTGEISGIPTSVEDLSVFVIYGENKSGAASVEITLSVRKGQCLAEGLFPSTDVGEVAVYDCAMQGSYVGTQKRSCILGTEDGVWEKASGFCISIATIVILVVIAIIVIAIVILILVRISKKKHAVGGVKGKKVIKSATKKTTKTVKV